jgi:hypothetical protein
MDCESLEAIDALVTVGVVSSSHSPIATGKRSKFADQNLDIFRLDRFSAAIVRPLQVIPDSAFRPVAADIRLFLTCHAARAALRLCGQHLGERRRHSSELTFRSLRTERMPALAGILWVMTVVQNSLRELILRSPPDPFDITRRKDRQAGLGL